MTGYPDISRRRSERSKVLLAATLRLPDRVQPVRLRDLSADGVLVDGAPGLSPGSEVTFCRNELSVPGVVAWTRGQLSGIRFVNPLAPHVVLRYIAVPAPMKIVDHKRPALRIRGLSAEERRWMEELAAPAKVARRKD